jgi:hypothetical protein
MGDRGGAYRVFGGRNRERKNFEDVGLDGKIIFK